MKFFIGYDTSQHEAAMVCQKSLERWVDKKDIFFLNVHELRAGGHYWREHSGNESTEFSYTRFLVPYLSNFTGESVFCDSDFLWVDDPRVLASANGPAVRVVKHDILPGQLSSTKMNGKVQEWYPMKNWSSMMLFNNAHPDCTNLTPEAVSEMSSQWLHQFRWTDMDKSAALPRRFNHLVGYYPKTDGLAAIHFTDGGPWLPGYEDVEYAEEWRLVQRSA